MYEKILQKLKEQRGQNLQVSDKTLEKMATRFAKYIDSDEKLAEEDFTEDIQNLQGNIGHIAKQVKEDTEKSFNEDKAKKDKDLADKKLAEEQKSKLPDDAPQYIKDILEQNQKLIEQSQKNAESLAGLHGDKIATTRKGSLEAILEKAPDFYKNQIIEGFENMSFENDETFNSYLEKTKTNFGTFQQQAKEQGLNSFTPKPEVKKEEKEELNPVFAQAMKARDEQEASKKE